MLVLTRGPDQEIRIGDNIVVRILDVKGERVRIGIAAPADVPVHRQEVYLEIERANRESLEIATAGLEGARTLAQKKKLGAAGDRARSRLETNPSDTTQDTVDTEVRHGA